MARETPKKKKATVKLEELMFYFDGVERDRLDAAGTSRKTGEVLALRDRLLRLPDDEFDATIKTVKGLLTEERNDGSDDASRARRSAEAQKLFTETRGAGGGGRTSKVSPA